MSNSLLIKFRLFTPQIWQQSVRHRGKFNVKNPRPRHDIARYLEEITLPVVEKELPNPVVKCLESKKMIANNLKFSTNEAIEYERVLSRHALKLIEENKIMLICHKHDCSGEVFRRNKIEFKKNETSVWNFNTLTMKLLIEQNPKYQNLYPIVDNALGRNYYLFSEEKNLKKNLQLLRKMPNLVLLGGMINGTLLTRAAIQNYVQLKDLDGQRAELCALLNNQLGLIKNSLSIPTLKFSQALEQHTKSLEGK